jgi:hypothetical protein
MAKAKSEAPKKARKARTDPIEKLKKSMSEDQIADSEKLVTEVDGDPGKSKVVRLAYLWLRKLAQETPSIGAKNEELLGVMEPDVAASVREALLEAKAKVNKKK